MPLLNENELHSRRGQGHIGFQSPHTSYTQVSTEICHNANIYMKNRFILINPQTLYNMNFGLWPQSILYKIFVFNNINLLFIYIFPQYIANGDQDALGLFRDAIPISYKKELESAKTLDEA